MSRSGRSLLPRFLVLLPVVAAHAQWIPPNPVIAVQRQSNGVLFSPKEGGRAIDAPAPLERIPLYVRAGSIIPMGPDVEYTTEKAADPIELRVYRGASGSFTIYEDENDNCNYEMGVYATIPIQWDEATRKLTIGARRGTFPGMLASRSFHVVFVRENRGAGIRATAQPDRVVAYSGRAVTVEPTP